MFFTEYYENLLAMMRKQHPGKHVQCYEAFTVHLAVVPFTLVMSQLEGITKAVLET